MSDEDISAGARWLPEISNELGQAKVGILCVTPENQTSPWLVFEAGALSKTLEQTFVCPMLFDLAPSQFKGPLAQFQSSTFEKAGVLRVVANLNAALPTRRLSVLELEEIFDVWWPKLAAKLEEVPFHESPATERRSTEDLLEEILSLSRDQLRRENLRLEHSQRRDERMDEVIPMFEKMAAEAAKMKERGNQAFTLLEKLPIPTDIKQLLGGDFGGDMTNMINMIRAQSDASRLETRELLGTSEKDGFSGLSDGDALLTPDKS